MSTLNKSFRGRIRPLLLLLKKHVLVRVINSELNRRKGEKEYANYEDEELIAQKYKRKTGREVNLSDPQSFNEKLQWLKLHGHNPDMAVCADKYLVRAYLQERGYGHLLNEMYGAWENVDDIDISSLPDEFVLKAAHGSGMNIICTDKRSMFWPFWKLLMKSWLKQNIYVYGREWVYKDMTPRIICEKLLKPESGTLLDYKFWCMNGTIAFIQVSVNDEDTLKLNLYDTSWNLKKEEYCYRNSKKQIAPPQSLNEMISYAQQLSAPFPFVRVDFYEVDGSVIFGELTFFPGSGFMLFNPPSYDYELGKMVRLPATG